MNKFNNSDLELNLSHHLKEARERNEVDLYFHVATDEYFDGGELDGYYLDLPADSYWYEKSEQRDQDLKLLKEIFEKEMLSMSINGVPEEY